MQKGYPLHEASQKGYTNCIKILLEEKFDIDELNNEGNTALHLACQENQAKVVKILLKSNVDTTLLNKENKTAIQCTTNETVQQIFEFNNLSIDNEPSASSNNTREGFLKYIKDRTKGRTWQQYWFTLNHKELTYYKTRKDAEPIATIETNKILAINRTEDLKKNNNTFQVVTQDGTFYLASSDTEQREHWVKLIQSFVKSENSTDKNLIYSNQPSRSLNQTAPSNLRSVSPISQHIHNAHNNNDNNNCKSENVKNNQFNNSKNEEEEMTMAENNNNNNDPNEYFGYLFKGGGQKSAASNWQKRWVILNADQISYYKKQGDAKPAGVIPLETVTLVEGRDDKKKNSFLLTTQLRDYYFYATSEEHREKWISAILENVLKKSKLNGGSINNNASLNNSTGNLGESNEAESVLASLLSNSVKPDKEGYLYKTPGSKKKPGNWQRRWFVLRGNFLFYFKQPKDTKPAGHVVLFNVTVATGDEIKSNSIFIHTTDRVFYLYANTLQERDSWLKTLHVNTSYS